MACATAGFDPVGAVAVLSLRVAQLASTNAAQPSVIAVHLAALIFMAGET